MSLLLDALKQLEARSGAHTLASIEPSPSPLPSASVAAYTPVVTPAPITTPAPDVQPEAHRPIDDGADFTLSEPAPALRSSTATATADALPVQVAPPASAPPPDQPSDAGQLLAVWDRLSRTVRGNLPSSLALVTLAGASDSKWRIPLAAAYTQRQPGRVLLVEASDASPHHDGASVAAGGVPRAGLVDLVRGRSGWRAAIARTTMPRIDMLVLGREEAAALFGDVRRAATGLHQAWEELKSDYAMALVSAGRGIHEISLALAASCDATMFLLNLERTPQIVALETQRRLQSSGAHLVGSLLCE